MEKIITSSLDTFRKLFPVTKLIVEDAELRYRFKNKVTAKYFEDLAQQTILANKLPLVAALETWEEGGYIFEISLEVKPVPEQYLVERL